ncbi:VCBS repeat-containing protein [uncultured Thiodictyon sp.]|uniref:FG-GAP repeat domain-containing protein n=1 Tax=uncultured Thiodictyon sp. TaxID=1846217 RepID=UPI0025FC8A1B|nr:VCBS repeat-containing protein [uncultured Thiodictyon sp.]
MTSETVRSQAQWRHRASWLAVSALLGAPGLATATGPTVTGTDAATSPLSSLPTVNVPRGIATGVFTGGGAADLVSVDPSANTVEVWLGNGDGTFVVPTPGAGTLITLPFGLGPYHVATGQLRVAFPLPAPPAPPTPDPRVDIVTVNQTNSTVSVLLGNGNGTFEVPVAYGLTDGVTAATGPRGVALGDVTGDGILDIVTANFASNSVTVLEGNGDGTFKTPVASRILAVDTGPVSVALAHAHSTTVLDIVTANQSANSISVLTNDGAGNFAAQVPYPVPGTAPVELAVGRFNTANSLDDVVTANYSTSDVSIMTNDGSGAFASTAQPFVNLLPVAVTVGDLNGDTLPDIAVAVTAGLGGPGVTVLNGNGDGSFEAAGATIGIGPAGSSVNDLAVADLDADGKVDLLASDLNQFLYVWLNTTPLSLTFIGDTMHITPQARNSGAIGDPPDFGNTQYYTIHYTSADNQFGTIGWGIWAKGWPSDPAHLNVDMPATLTAAACVNKGATTTVCYRPRGVEIKGPTHYYRIFAKGDAGGWTPPSSTQSYTRP